VRLLSFDPRCASRYEPSRHELALVSSGRGPYMEIRFRAGACSRCSPDRLPFEERIVDCSLDPVSPVSSAAEARSRARPAWDASGGDPGPFDRYLQPTRFVFQRRARPSRCVPNRVAHAIREPPVLRRWPASAVRALLFSRIACRGIYSASRRTACLLTSLALSPRAIGTSPALAYSESSEPSFVAPRERSRRGIRLRTPFLLSCLPPRPTNRPKRVALRSVQPMIARATQKSFCNVSPTRRHFSAPQAPASHESGSAQPKPWASSPLRFTREENRRRHPRAGEVRSRGARVLLLLGARSPASLDLRASTPSSSPRDLRRLGPPPRPRGRSRSSCPDQVPSSAGFRARLSPTRAAPPCERGPRSCERGIRRAFE